VISETWIELRAQWQEAISDGFNGAFREYLQGEFGMNESEDLEAEELFEILNSEVK